MAMDFTWLLWIVGAFIAWSLLHSLTAARRVKAWVRARWGQRAYDGFYRLVYNLVSVLTILPLLYLLATRAPSTVLWRVRWPWQLLFLLVQGLGLLGLIASLLQTDVWRFVGVRQVLRYLQGEEKPDPPARFVASGTYGLVRHPLYLFSMLVIWFTPLMTVGTLLFNILASVYFWVGSWHEERRLEREFGEAYRAYRRKVPGFLPRLRAIGRR
jgi:methanethiol S-methyltransferase